MSFEENINSYNVAIKQIVDNHAPIKTKTVKEVRSAPWFDGEYEELRRKRRHAEKQFRNTGCTIHKENYTKLGKQAIALAHKKKCQYYDDKLSTGNVKEMYAAINIFLDKKQEKVLPTASSDVELANTMMTFFNDKIEKIRSSFPATSDSQIFKMSASHGKLCDLGSITEDELKEIISTHGIKCSPDDPAPANLLQNHLELFVPIWTKHLLISLWVKAAWKDLRMHL